MSGSLGFLLINNLFSVVGIQNNPGKFLGNVGAVSIYSSIQSPASDTGGDIGNKIMPHAIHGESILPPF
jgi:hypothetical protein